MSEVDWKEILAGKKLLDKDSAWHSLPVVAATQRDTKGHSIKGYVDLLCAAERPLEVQSALIMLAARCMVEVERYTDMIRENDQDSV